MKQGAPSHPLSFAPRAALVALYAATLMGWTPQASAQPSHVPASAAQAATTPAEPAAAPQSAARDSAPPMVNGVEMSGIGNTVALERVVSGHLVSLNGRYKLRGTMTIFEPGGYLGAHHHAGPGLRYVLAGDLTCTEAGRTRVYHRGDWFYESGDTLNTAANHSAARDTILNFEILPADWYGASTMPAPGSH